MKFYTYSLAIAFLACFYVGNILFGGYPMPKSEQAVNDFLSKAIHSFKQKYPYKAIGENTAMPEGIVKLIGLSFDVEGPLDRKEIRRILLEMGIEFIKWINEDETIRPYLETYPVSVNNIDISIFLYDANSSQLRDPYIGYATIGYGQIRYSVKDERDGIPFTKHEYTETYEEALKACFLNE
jgi:hypothetical protein